MVPPPGEASSRDAHVAVANPDDAQHPEDIQTPAPRPGPRSAAQDATGAMPTGEQARQREPIAACNPASLRAAGGQTDWQAQPILLDVQKECFSRLLLLPEILVDHLPDTYLAAVQQL